VGEAGGLGVLRLRAARFAQNDGEMGWGLPGWEKQVLPLRGRMTSGWGACAGGKQIPCGYDNKKDKGKESPSPLAPKGQTRRQKQSGYFALLEVTCVEGCIP